MSDHTSKAFDHELDALTRRISKMGGVAEKMLVEAMGALAASDINLAHQVVSTDARLDALQREIEEAAVLTIARRQPVACDLRECIAAIRIAGNLQRVGNNVKNIALCTVKIAGDVRLSRAIIGPKSMHEFAATQLKDVLDAYAQRDVEQALMVWFNAADLDSIEDSVLRDLITFMMEDPRNVSFCTHLLFCSKNLERIGDHATNIAEAVVYLVAGEAMPIERPKTKIASPSIDGHGERATNEGV